MNVCAPGAGRVHNCMHVRAPVAGLTYNFVGVIAEIGVRGIIDEGAHAQPLVHV